MPVIAFFWVAFGFIAGAQSVSIGKEYCEKKEKQVVSQPAVKSVAESVSGTAK